MPGMDGFELLDEIRALGSDAGGSVPVIAMSAFMPGERAYILAVSNSHRKGQSRSFL
jgi:CheY-like chemotaxis protein